MSTLTGQQIQNSYQGLLKLADSTTGITDNLQAIQDGLGNNTGLRITTNQLEIANVATFVPLKAKFIWCNCGTVFLVCDPNTNTNCFANTDPNTNKYSNTNRNSDSNVNTSIKQYL